MRLATYQDGTIRRVGAVCGHSLVDLSAFTHDMLALIDAGPSFLAQIREMIETADTVPVAVSHTPLMGAMLLAPIPRPRKNMVCLGKNYAEHVVETARARGKTEALPEYPVFFTKAVTTINHPDGTIPYDPQVSTEIDWEVELALIIGQRGKNIARDEAMRYVFGYTIMNDITARDMQRNHRLFFKGKSLDGCAPLGPWIVTADEVPDPHNLGLRLRVNGKTMQEGHTSQMIFKIPDLIVSLSRGMTLEPGDIIATGTPAGVGMAMDPPRFLKPGDVIEAEIDGIGVLRSRVGDGE